MANRIGYRLWGAPIAFTLLALTPLPALAAGTASPVLRVDFRGSASADAHRLTEGDLQSRCGALGVRSSRFTKDPVNATALVEVIETPGALYNKMGYIASLGTERATNLTYRVRLTASDGRLLLELESHGVPPERVTDRSLYQAAVDDLQLKREFYQACSAIAAALGLREEAVKLLPSVMRSPQLLRGLESTGFQAQTPTEQAYLALAHRNIGEARGLGAPALKPLQDFLRAYLNLRDAADTGPLPKATDDDLRDVALAVDSLAAVAMESPPASRAAAQDGATNTVRELLRLFPTSERFVPALRATMAAIGILGIAQVDIASLDRFVTPPSTGAPQSKGEPAIRSAALDATRAIESRRAARGRPTITVVGKTVPQTLDRLASALPRRGFVATTRTESTLVLEKTQSHPMLGLTFTERLSIEAVGDPGAVRIVANRVSISSSGRNAIPPLPLDDSPLQFEAVTKLLELGIE